MLFLNAAVTQNILPRSTHCRPFFRPLTTCQVVILTEAADSY